MRACRRKGRSGKPRFRLRRCPCPATPNAPAEQSLRRGDPAEGEQHACDRHDLAAQHRREQQRMDGMQSLRRDVARSGPDTARRVSTVAYRSGSKVRLDGTIGPLEPHRARSGGHAGRAHERVLSPDLGWSPLASRRPGLRGGSGGRRCLRKAFGRAGERANAAPGPAAARGRRAPALPAAPPLPRLAHSGARTGSRRTRLSRGCRG